MRIGILSVTLLLMTSTFGSAVTHAGTLRLERAAIIDTGYGQPMIAATLFKPYGWKETGGIAWGQEHACTNGWGVNWSAEAADGRRGVAILPQQGWEQSSEGRPSNFNCALLQLNGVEDYLRKLAQHVHTNARVVGYRARPDLAQLTPTPPNQSIQGGFMRTTSRVEAGEILVDQPKDGITIRMSLSTAVTITDMSTGGPGFGLGPPIQTRMFSADPTFAFYAPANAFKPALYEGLRRSITPDQNWLNQTAQHAQKLDKIATKGIVDRAKITSRSQAEIAEMTHKAWQSNQRSSDARAADFVNTIREVENYRDPMAIGGQVELSNQYNHAWRLQDGSYVLTDDASFQPQLELGVSGQPLSGAR